jgi:hypothetical protein
MRSNKRLITSIYAQTVKNKKLDFLNFLKHNHKDYIEAAVSQELKLFLDPFSTNFLSRCAAHGFQIIFCLAAEKIKNLSLLLAHFTLPAHFKKKLPVTLFKAKKAAILSVKIPVTESRL